MRNGSPDIALRRVLDALEAEILNASDAEIESAVAETGSRAGQLLADIGAALGLRSVRPDLDKSGEQAAEPDDDAPPDRSDAWPHPRSH